MGNQKIFPSAKLKGEDFAAAVLLHHFADEHLENAGDGEWKEFLKGLKQ